MPKIKPRETRTGLSYALKWYMEAPKGRVKDRRLKECMPEWLHKDKGKMEEAAELLWKIKTAHLREDVHQPFALSDHRFAKYILIGVADRMAAKEEGGKKAAAFPPRMVLDFKESHDVIAKLSLLI